MIVAIVILSTLLALFIIYSVILTRVAVMQVDKGDKWEEFYVSTLDDIEQSRKYLEQLLGNEIISADPDVQNLRRLVKVLHQTLIGYANAV